MQTENTGRAMPKLKQKGNSHAEAQRFSFSAPPRLLREEKVFAIL
ncbi:MAG: hypothetical protein M2R45_04117 [Verrucomicrobia subdivision 3 bacterium]|nr:hypothetical protein [Limisphaerales bacterium]MCS1417080.1 hypothetical protein [Limisphaerales bacterium]